MLGGSIDADLSVAHATPVVRSAADRVIVGGGARAQISRTRASCSPAAAANLISNDAREADYAGEMLESLGIPRSRLTIERQLAQHGGEC